MERGDGERVDAMKFVARVLVQIPDPRRHSARYYGMEDDTLSKLAHRTLLVAAGLRTGAFFAPEIAFRRTTASGP